MSIEENILINNYVPFNKDVPYKDWLISAIKIKDWNEFVNIIAILATDKNSLGAIELITISNLRFVLMMLRENEDYVPAFEGLLRSVLQLKDEEVVQLYINEKTEYLLIGIPKDNIHGRVIFNDSEVRKITAEDFDEIRRIILYQTFVDYTDRYIDPDVKNAADEYYRLKNKNAPNVSLEHKIICMQMKTGMNLETIGNLTVRNFNQLFETIIEESDYNLYRLAEINGATFKKPLKHWAYKERTDRYADAFCDAEEFTHEVQSAN